MKAAVVIRKLEHEGRDPTTVVSAVILERDGDSADNAIKDGALLTRSAAHIRQFKAKFPEFNYADWSTQIVDTE